MGRSRFHNPSKIYTHFVRNFNPGEQGKQQMLKIAVGPGGDGPEWTNLDPNQPIEIEASLANITAKSAGGETLTAPNVDSVNTFDAPHTVLPKPVSAKVQGGKLGLKLEPKSVSVISVEQ
jgi:alpha-N-arabinofuranosidase